MKSAKILVVLFAIATLTACELFGPKLTNEEIVAGLKEALRVGSENSVTKANANDGYNGNSLIKIPFPQDAQFVYDAVAPITLLGAPIGRDALDAFVLKLNRAAENAADKAGPIFLNAINAITITDGMNILMGADDAATSFLKNGTYSSLKTAFKPDIENSLNTVGAQTAWNQVMTLYNTVSSAPVNTDLADHTTGKALDGLFILVAGEELKIRQDPSARVTDLLKKVFAEQD